VDALTMDHDNINKAH